MASPRHGIPEVVRDREFGEYYRRHLQPLEGAFERLRREAVGDHLRRIAAALAAWLGAGATIVWLARPIGEYWVFVGFAALVTGVGLGMWAWLPAGAHRLRLQEQVLSRIVPFFGDLRYSSEPDLSPGAFEDWKLLPYFTKTYKEDQIEGSHGGVPLTRCCGGRRSRGSWRRWVGGRLLGACAKPRSTKPFTG